MTRQELATVLAALRYYRNGGQGEAANRDHRTGELASDFGAVVPMDTAQVEALFTRLRTAGHDDPPPPPSRVDVVLDGRTYAVRRNLSGMFAVEVFMPTTARADRHWRVVRAGPTAEAALAAALQKCPAWRDA